MPYPDVEPLGEDVIYRPTIGLTLLWRARACGCMTTEYVEPLASSRSCMLPRDIMCEHGHPMIPFET